jgi:hypothetical protein
LLRRGARGRKENRRKNQRKNRRRASCCQAGIESFRLMLRRFHFRLLSACFKLARPRNNTTRCG